MAVDNVVIRHRISGFVLLSAWLLVFALPAFLICTSLDYLFSMTRTANKRMISSSMIGEMESFRREIDTVNFLQKRLGSYFKSLPKTPDAGDAKAIAANLAAATGLRPDAVITHGADTIDTYAFFSDRFAAKIKGFSHNLMRRYLVAVNHQYLQAFHNTANQAVIEGLFRFVDPAKSKKDSDLFLRRIFALLAEVPVLPERVSKSLSSNLGGVLYFYYHPIYQSVGDKKLIKSGFFLVFSGSSIAWRDVAGDAILAASFGIKRGLAVSPVSLWEDSTNRKEIITRFHEDDKGCHLYSTLSQTAMVDLIQAGSFMPRHLEQVCRRMPLLKISVPWSALQHPLMPWFSFIIFCCRLYVMAGALFLLRFHLFGIDVKASIAVKVVVGTAFILLLPVVLLFAGYTTANQLNLIYRWYAADSEQRRMFAELNEKFTAYQNALQQKSFDIAGECSRLLASGREDSIKPLLQKWIKGSLASNVSLDLPHGRSIGVDSSRHEIRSNSREDANRRLTSIAVFSAFNDAGKFTRINFDDGPRDITGVDSRFVNDVVNRWGKFYKLFRLHVGTRFSSIYINRAGRNDPLAHLTIKYSDERLLKALVRRFIEETVEYRDLDSEYLLVRDDAGIKRFYSLFSNVEIRDHDLVGRLNLAAVSGQHARRFENRDLEQIFSMSDYPLLLLTRTRDVSGQYGSLAFSGVLLIYALLLLAFVFLVFMLIYLRPIHEFIRVTERVAAGDYQCQVELDQTDEFGDLKQTFDTMIQGLEQRRRLTQFVSSEVIKAVESESAESMAVGGERIEATVAFVQLAKLQHLQNEASPAEAFAILGDFIAAADIAASQHGGVVDKLVEDTLMLVFRADPARPEHALAASTAVLELERQMRARDLRIFAGIASGQVVSGRIGSRLGKLDLTVIGDPVNLAARLKAQAKKASSTGIIISPAAIRILKGRARVNFIERTELKGKSREYPLYELVALRLAEK